MRLLHSFPCCSSHSVFVYILLLLCLCFHFQPVLERFHTILIYIPYLFASLNTYSIVISAVRPFFVHFSFRSATNIISLSTLTYYIRPCTYRSTLSIAKPFRRLVRRQVPLHVTTSNRPTVTSSFSTSTWLLTTNRYRCP